MKRKPLTTILGIELTRDRLSAVELRLKGGQTVVERVAEAALAVDVMNSDPELAGSEIVSHLDAAGIRARKCVLCLSGESLLIQNVDLTGVEEGDVEGLLVIEAERGFPFAPEDLILASSRYVDPSGKPFATLAAVAVSHLNPLLAALHKAKLQVIGVTPSAPALLDTENRAVDAALVVDGKKLLFAVGAGQGVSLLRSFAGVTLLDDAKNADESADFDELRRELRLTLRRLAPDLRAALKRVRIFGRRDIAAPIKEILEGELSDAGLRAVYAGVNETGTIVEAGGGQPLPAVTRAAARILDGHAPALEFWRPREPRWRAQLRRLMARGILVRLGLAAGLAVFLLASAFAFQGWRLSSRENRWSAMRPDVDRLQAIQDGIRARRAWIDTEPERLDILRALTAAFPETGSVWLRSIEIREAGTVACLGFGKSNRACLETLKTLRDAPGVTLLQVDQMRGDNPVQFSFRYTWKKETAE